MTIGIGLLLDTLIVRSPDDPFDRGDPRTVVLVATEDRSVRPLGADECDHRKTPAPVAVGANSGAGDADLQPGGDATRTGTPAPPGLTLRFRRGSSATSRPGGGPDRRSPTSPAGPARRRPEPGRHRDLVGRSQAPGGKAS